MGERIRPVISVAMLSEGWDAKTVTHIMGLRAFSSQLLCEQVVGRGLRRTSYEVNDNGFFEPEYVNIFGVPFTFRPHESPPGGIAEPPRPKTEIRPDPAKARFEIRFPIVIRVERTYRTGLGLVDRFLRSDLIRIDGLWNRTPERRGILVSLNMTRIVQHLWLADTDEYRRTVGHLSYDPVLLVYANLARIIDQMGSYEMGSDAAWYDMLAEGLSAVALGVGTDDDYTGAPLVLSLPPSTDPVMADVGGR